MKPSIRLATLALVLAVAAAVVGSAVVAGHPTRHALRVSRDFATRLTHAWDYTPPPVPAEGAWSFAARELAQFEEEAEASEGSDAQQQQPGALCGPCQTVVQLAEWVAQSNSSMTLVEDVLDGLCAKLRPNSTTCPKVVDLLVRVAERVPGLMNHIGLYEPIRACSFLGACQVQCCEDETTPQQVALGLGRNSSERHVSWVTGGDASSTVTYGTDPNNLDQVAEGYSLTYTDGGWLGVIHRVVMTGLQAQSVYYYAVGGAGAQSAVYNFTTIDDEITLPFSIAVVGDMAVNDNLWSPLNIAFLNAAVQAQMFQAVIHVGDISYADGYMKSWDDFFTALQPTMTSVPYQVIPGNHELLFNFTAFTSRFFTSGLGAQLDLTPEDLADGLSGTNLWSSYDVGCVHFLALCSEDNFNTAWLGENQLTWVEADLQRTKARMVRAAEEGRVDAGTCSVEAPTFLVVYLHRPLYCSDADADNCGQGPEAAYLRGKLEDLFVQYGVDLVIYGHMHNMERSVNVYQSQPNPAGPMYITHGAGGNREGIEDNWVTPPPVWSAIQASVVGVGSLSVLDSSTLEWTFLAQQNASGVPVLENVKVIDQVFVQARQRTKRAFEEQEKVVRRARGEVEAAAAAGEVAAPLSQTFVSISDPAWFFSPYNFAFSQPFAQGDSIWAQTNNPGAYFKLSFTGSSFVLQLNMSGTPPAQDYMKLRWSIDDGAWQTATLPSSLSGNGQLVLATGLPSSGAHTLLVYVLCSVQGVDRWVLPANVLRVTGGFVDGGAELQPYPSIFNSSILVYWDSIGEGFMANGHVAPDNELSNNDAIATWIPALGLAYRAEVGAVAFAGQGYIRTGSAHPFMHPNETAAEHAWSHFSQGVSRLDEDGQLVPQPDAIFCGHGTNDNSYAPADVQEAAQAWLAAVRASVPARTQVFLVAPFGGFQAAALQQAFAAFEQEAGPTSTYYVDLRSYGSDEQLNGCGKAGRLSADCVHPLSWRAEQLAAILTAGASAAVNQADAKALQQQPLAGSRRKHRRAHIRLVEV